MRDAERGQLGVRDRALDHGRADAEPDQLLDVGLHRPREAPDLGAQPGVRDQPDRLLVLRRDAREAGLDPVDARLVERVRDRELVLRREHDADCLLAVAQGRVVEADRVVRLRLEREAVEIARPDLLAVDVMRRPHDPVREAAEPLGAALGDQEVVLDAKAAALGPVHPGLDRQHHAGLDRATPGLVRIGRLVRARADAVADRMARAGPG